MTFTTLYGVADDPLPPPRVIRGSEQVFPPARGRTYTEQLEVDLAAAQRHNARLIAQVADLEGRLEGLAQEAAQLRSRGGRPVPRSRQSTVREAAFRRARRAQAGCEPVDLGLGVTFDPDGWRLRVGKRVVPLSSNEGLLLRALASRRGAMVLKKDLRDAVWQGDAADRHLTHTLQVLTNRLRSKLREAGCDGLITTIHGIGLRLEVDS